MPSSVSIQLPDGTQVTVPLIAIGAAGADAKANQTAISEFTIKILKDFAINVDARFDSELKGLGSEPTGAINLMLSTPNDMMYLIPALPNDTIAKVKGDIYDRTRIPVHQQKLMCFVDEVWTEMKDKDTLSQSGIKGVTGVVVIRKGKERHL